MNPISVLHRYRLARLVALSCSLALLAGCVVFHAADSGLDAANAELDTTARQLATGDITLTARDHDAPKARITPQGDFLVADETVAISPGQRTELLAYRAQYVDIARQGIAIGRQGVEVARHAVAPMIIAALFGASDDSIEASMHKRLAGVGKASEALCARLPQLRMAQQQLAADLPAFEPYATLTQKDIDDCQADVRDSFAVADDGSDRE